MEEIKREEETWKCFSTVEEDIGKIDELFGCYGFRDREGRIMIEPQYLSCGEFHCGLCPVALGRTWYRTERGERYYEMHWGYIDKTGKVVIPFRFRQAWSFNRYGVAVVRDEYTENAYLIDTDGKPIPDSAFPDISHYEEYEDRYIIISTTPMWDDGTVGLYDTKERRVLYPLTANDFDVFGDERIRVEEPALDAAGIPMAGQRRVRFINSEGKELPADDSGV